QRYEPRKTRTSASARSLCGLVQEKPADTPRRLGKQSGKALTILDGCEDERSHVWERMIRGTRQSEHGVYPIIHVNADYRIARGLVKRITEFSHRQQLLPGSVSCRVVERSRLGLLRSFKSPAFFFFLLS
ncbi:MAG TPA: hypothetical protein VH575_17650, partial [Gemmataceae bacterium]